MLLLPTDNTDFTNIFLFCHLMNQMNLTYDAMYYLVNLVNLVIIFKPSSCSSCYPLAPSLLCFVSDVPFIASPALIHRHALCFELRVLIKILPSIILRLVGLLSLPRMLLSSIMFRVRLKRRHLVEVFVSVFTHVLFLCYFVSSVVITPIS